MRIMRSWMFVPGHQQRMIDKAYGLKLDVGCSMEDAARRKKYRPCHDACKRLIVHRVRSVTRVGCSVSFVFILLGPKK